MPLHAEYDNVQLLESLYISLRALSASSILTIFPCHDDKTNIKG